jgi:signal transduction histidine kinase
MARKSQQFRDDHTILVVDNRDETRLPVRSLLEREGCRVLTAGSSGEALELFIRARPDVLIIDQSITDATNGELIRRVQLLDGNVPIILRCERPDRSRRQRLMREFELHGIDNRDGDTDHLRELVQSAVRSMRRMKGARAEQELRGVILAKLCHELRTFLHIIRGYTEILGSDPADSSVGGILERLEIASDTALGVAQEYLDLACLDLPGVTVRQEPVNIDLLLDDLRNLGERKIDGRPLRLHTHMSLRGACICTDGEKLRAILAQLLAATIASNVSGEIQLTVRPAPAHTDFVLADTGPGITAADLPSTPGGFSRSQDEPAATVPGQGLGLAIARRLSALIGASLTAHVVAGAGATFILSLPWAVTQRDETCERTLH